MSYSGVDHPLFCGQCGSRLLANSACPNPSCSLYDRQLVESIGPSALLDVSTEIDHGPQTPLMPSQRSSIIPPPPPPPFAAPPQQGPIYLPPVPSSATPPPAGPSAPLPAGPSATPPPAGPSAPLPAGPSATPPPASSSATPPAGSSATPSPSAARPRRRPGMLLYTVVALVLILVVVASLIFVVFKPGSSPNTSTSSSSQTSANQGTTAPVSNTTPSSISTATAPAVASQTVAPSPSPTSLPAPGVTLCQADASHGWNGWSGPPDWKILNGTLLNDGTNQDMSLQPTIVAPCQLDGISDYAVEARIQIVSFNNQSQNCFAITVRGDPTQSQWQGYIAAIDSGCVSSTSQTVIAVNSLGSDKVIAHAPFNPGSGFHTYRVEVKGNSIKILVDGGEELSVIDNRYLDTSQVGLASYGCQLIITSFKVISL